MSSDDAIAAAAAAAAAGREYGMTPDETLQHIAVGDESHPDAPATDCGARDPRRGAGMYWCVRAPGHARDEHSRYLPGEPADSWRHRWNAAAARRS